MGHPRPSALQPKKKKKQTKPKPSSTLSSGNLVKPSEKLGGGEGKWDIVGVLWGIVVYCAANWREVQNLFFFEKKIAQLQCLSPQILKFTGERNNFIIPGIVSACCIVAEANHSPVHPFTSGLAILWDLWPICPPPPQVPAFWLLIAGLEWAEWPDASPSWQWQ